MVSDSSLAILIPLLFVILIQMINVARKTAVPVDYTDQDYHPPGEMPSVGYDEFPRQKFAHIISDTLPTLGRWGTSMGVFGILHIIITSFILSQIVLLGIVGFTDNRLALFGVLGLVIIWLVLPFLEVEEYQELTAKNIRPKSIDFNFYSVLLMVIPIIITLSGMDVLSSNFPVTIAGYSISKNIIFLLGGYSILHFHNLIYNPTFLIMLSQEMQHLSTAED
jgi:hypothetical protein